MYFPTNGLEMCRALLLREDRPKILNLPEFEEFCELIGEAGYIALNMKNDKDMYLKLLNKTNKSPAETQQLAQLQNDLPSRKQDMQRVIDNIANNRYCQRMLLMDEGGILNPNKEQRFKWHFI